MHHPRLITLLTDFGLTDPFVGIMKGVIARVDPRLRLIDLTHGIPAQDVKRGAMALVQAVPHFPKGTVYLAVVDPGVGSDRRPVAIRFPGGFLVGPDNGVFGAVLAKWPALAAIQLDQPRYWHAEQPSRTFHGRDLFAPIAAHLARGTAFAKLGTPIDPQTLQRLPMPEIRHEGRRIFGEVVGIDHFGNLLTNIPAEPLAGGPWSVTVAGSEIAVVGTYAEAPVGALAALIGSHGCVEIAVNQGRAADRLGIGVGEPVSVGAILLRPLSQRAEAGNDRMSGESLWETLKRRIIRSVYVRWLAMRGRTMRFEDAKGPINSAAWATFVINGNEHSDGDRMVGAGNDLRIIGSEVTSWKERRGHRLSAEMLTGVHESGLELLILGLGFDRQIACPAEVVEEIRRQGVPEVVLAETPEACRLFNEAFRAGKRVGMLIHGTC